MDTVKSWIVDQLKHRIQEVWADAVLAWMVATPFLILYGALFFFGIGDVSLLDDGLMVILLAVLASCIPYTLGRMRAWIFFTALFGLCAFSGALFAMFLSVFSQWDFVRMGNIVILSATLLLLVVTLFVGAWWGYRKPKLEFPVRRF